MEVNIRNYKKNKHRINKDIKAREVMLIDQNGASVGVVDIFEALKIAKSVNLDLVEIASQSNPPVCKILDYGKMLYNEQKKQAETKKKQVKVDIKEVQFSPAIGINDFNVKFNKIKEFINLKQKVKITLRFRGREMAHKELGFKIFDRIKELLLGSIKIEKDASMEGKQISMIISGNGVKLETKSSQKIAAKQSESSISKDMNSDQTLKTSENDDDDSKVE